MMIGHGGATVLSILPLALRSTAHAVGPVLVRKSSTLCCCSISIQPEQRV